MDIPDSSETVKTLQSCVENVFPPNESQIKEAFEDRPISTLQTLLMRSPDANKTFHLQSVIKTTSLQDDISQEVAFITGKTISHSLPDHGTVEPTNVQNTSRSKTSEDSDGASELVHEIEPVQDQKTRDSKSISKPDRSSDIVHEIERVLDQKTSCSKTGGKPDDSPGLYDGSPPETSNYASPGEEDSDTETSDEMFCSEVEQDELWTPRNRSKARVKSETSNKNDIHGDGHQHWSPKACKVEEVNSCKSCVCPPLKIYKRRTKSETLECSENATGHGSSPADEWSLKEIKTEVCDSPTESRLQSPPSQLQAYLQRDIVDENAPKRARRIKKKREAIERCPICSLTLRLPELTSHFHYEVDKINKLHRSLKKPPTGEKLHKTFHQVRDNRENRLTARAARLSSRAKSEVKCPVCKLRLSGCSEDISTHVALCFQNEDLYDEDVVVDEDMDEDEFEEYEFADQTRVRAVSFVQGGHRTLEGGHPGRRRQNNEDEDVDIDDTIAFGQPQYTEMDVIPHQPSNGEDESREQLRKAVLMDPTVQPQILESRKWAQREDNVPVKDFVVETNPLEPSTNVILASASSSYLTGKGEIPNINMKRSQQILSSLREKIKDLEDDNKRVKCLICMEPYTKPVVSTTCWHVYCEECWLMTMGVKKLCPQCNMIVFPSDLRKIYL